MAPTIAIRFRFPTLLVDNPEAARRVADVLAWPCFARLERVAAKQGDRTVKGAKATASVIAAYLGEPAFEGIVIESGGTGDLVASAALPNGEHARSWPLSCVRYYGYVVVPFAATETEQVVQGACELAADLDARSGAITVEPTYRLAQRWALEIRPTRRAGLTDRRMAERRAHRRFEDDLASKVSGPDWGLFLSRDHLAQLDRQELAAAAARVIDVSASLVYVQASLDPLDELTDAFDARLDGLRRALAPVLMDSSGVDN